MHVRDDGDGARGTRGPGPTDDHAAEQAEQAERDERAEQDGRSDGGSLDGGAAALAAETNAAMTTGRFARWLATRTPPIPADGVPLDPETIRLCCAERGMPGVEKRGKNWIVVDLDAALAWCRDVGLGLRHHGGRADGDGGGSAGSGGAGGAHGVVGAAGAAGTKERYIAEQTRRLAIGNERELGNLVPFDEVLAAVTAGVSRLRMHLEGLEHDAIALVEARAELSPEARRLLERDLRGLLERTVGHALDNALGGDLDEALDAIAEGET